MLQSPVNIDFDVMATALRNHVREKAARSNSTIIYLKNGVIIKEAPTTLHFQ